MSSPATREIPFVKAHAHGNDFILVSETDWQPLPEQDVHGAASHGERVRAWCDRTHGIGGDGLIVFAERSPVRMTLYNRDGGRAEISGNGVRCLAAYLAYAGHAGFSGNSDVEIDTDAGLIRLTFIERDRAEFLFRADMGCPRLASDDVPMECKPAQDRVLDEPLEVDGEALSVTALSMGNPHCVLFFDRLDRERLEKIGPRIEEHPRFPEKTNVEFVRVVSDKIIQMMIWERGAGLTQSSGTGSAASAVAAVLRGSIRERVEVQTPGGDMEVEWKNRDHVFVTGRAKLVALGRYLELT